jgi:hypothetical protein
MDSQRNTHDGSSGRPGTLPEISYFANNCSTPHFTIIILGLGKTTNSQDRFPAIQIPHVYGLAFPYNPDNPRLTFCFLPPPFLSPHTGDMKWEPAPPLPDCYQVWPAPPLPTALWEEFWVVKPNYKYWVQMKGSSGLTCCHMDLWPLWFSLIIIIRNSPHHPLLRKSE